MLPMLPPWINGGTNCRSKPLPAAAPDGRYRESDAAVTPFPYRTAPVASRVVGIVLGGFGVYMVLESVDQGLPFWWVVGLAWAVAYVFTCMVLESFEFREHQLGRRNCFGRWRFYQYPDVERFEDHGGWVAVIFRNQSMWRVGQHHADIPRVLSILRTRARGAEPPFRFRWICPETWLVVRMLRRISRA